MDSVNNIYPGLRVGILRAILGENHILTPLL